MKGVSFFSVLMSEKCWLGHRTPHTVWDVRPKDFLCKVTELIASHLYRFKKKCISGAVLGENGVKMVSTFKKVCSYLYLSTLTVLRS